MATQPVSTSEDRGEPRDAVFHRTRLTRADRCSTSAVVVNLSPQGLMLRVDTDIAVGESIRLSLPMLGELDAVVRWSLGGRLGCKLVRGIDPATYFPLLARIAA